MADKSTCSIEGCSTLARKRGYCNLHYSRWYRHGDPTAGRGHVGEALKFLKEKALTYEDDGCLDWPFGKFSNGYGVVWFNGKNMGAHRVVCELAHGPPSGPGHKQEAAHECGNKSCCNPRHLRWATPKENKADMIKHGTALRGAKHWASRLTVEDVKKIRAAFGSVPNKVLAARFNTSKENISMIGIGKSWAWLEGSA